MEWLGITVSMMLLSDKSQLKGNIECLKPASVSADLTGSG